jgi:hypothetical protein
LLRCRTGAHADTVVRHGKEVTVALFPEIHLDGAPSVIRECILERIGE